MRRARSYSHTIGMVDDRSRIRNRLELRPVDAPRERDNLFVTARWTRGTNSMRAVIE